MTTAPPHAPAFTKAESRQARRLGTVLALTAVFVVLEFAGAVAARSQVLLADAVHLLLDVFALGLSIVAMRIAIKAPTERFTFGFRRVEPLAAVLNGVLVLLASTVIVAESWNDLRSTVAPRPTVMVIVAAAALVIHGWSAWLIHDAIEHRAVPADSHAHEHARGQPHRHHGHTLNLRGVWLHLVGDALGAIAALAAAIVIRAGGPTLVDPLGGILVALLLAGGALKLLHDDALVLLDAAPPHLPTHAVRELVRSEPGVVAIADLRVWTLGAGHDAVAVKVKSAGQQEGLAARLGERLRHELGVELVTVEITED